MVPRLLLVLLLLLSSAAAWTDDFDHCDFEESGSGFPPEQTMENGACTVQADPRERAQCKKQLKIAKEAMKHFLKFANKDYGHFYDQPVFKDVKTFRLIANGSEPHSYNNYRAFDEDLTEVIRDSLVYYMEYDGEKVVENIPNRSLQVVSIAWTKNQSPLAFTLTLDFKKNKLRQVTVELEKNNEDQSPHPEGSGEEEPLEECTDRSSSLEDNRDCQEQDRFAKRIIRVLADFRIVFYYIYAKDLKEMPTYFNSWNPIWEPDTFMQVQHNLKANSLNHGLNTFVLGNLVENIPHKSIKYNFSVVGEKRSISGSLGVVFNETGVDFIDIQAENTTWMPRKSEDYDCEDETTKFNDCKKQVLTLEAILDGINSFIRGEEPEQLKLLRNIDIIWRPDYFRPTGWEEFKPKIEMFINREGIEKFYLDSTNHINEENVIFWNWIGKSTKKDVKLRVRMGYDVKEAKRGRNGIKKLSFDLI